MRSRRPLRRLLHLIATLAVAAGAAAMGGSATARAASDPNYCPPGHGDHPCGGCPREPRGSCSSYEDRGRVDVGRTCCDPACVNFRSNPSGQYEDYLWVYGWSYHNRVTGQNYRQSYIGGKGGTEGPWTVRGQFHQPVCS
jgi:hypothetical protein